MLRAFCECRACETDHFTRVVLLCLHHATPSSYSWAPTSSSIELSTLYASALSNFSTTADVGKLIDIRNGVLSTEVLNERLGAKR